MVCIPPCTRSPGGPLKNDRPSGPIHTPLKGRIQPDMKPNSLIVTKLWTNVHNTGPVGGVTAPHNQPQTRNPHSPNRGGGEQTEPEGRNQPYRLFLKSVTASTRSPRTRVAKFLDTITPKPQKGFSPCNFTRFLLRPRL